MTDTEIANVGKALSHRLRIEMIRELRAGTALSPKDLSKRLSEPLGNVSYHCSALRKAGMLTLTDTQKRRGALEHYYLLDGSNSEPLLAALDAIS
jgi:DNA-binding transcriptional ArsR family regulator